MALVTGRCRAGREAWSPARLSASSEGVPACVRAWQVCPEVHSLGLKEAAAASFEKKTFPQSEWFYLEKVGPSLVFRAEAPPGSAGPGRQDAVVHGARVAVVHGAQGGGGGGR